MQLALPSVLSSVGARDETRGVSGHVPLGAACTAICSVECGTLQGVCSHVVTRPEESLVHVPLGAACTTVCSVECGTLQGVCSHAVT